MKGKLTIIAGLIIILLAAIAAKLLFFPSIKDACFASSFRQLQQAPRGLVVLRPTHYPFLRHADPTFAPSPHSRTNHWISGRNAPLSDVLAVAYDKDPSHVLLPSNAPKGNFDFLVTIDNRPREQLQAAIRRKLGCQAHVEMREAEVFALKVVDPALPGLTVSDASAHQGWHYDGANIHFTNMPIAVVGEVISDVLNLKVVDKTGLTKSYDYSFPIPQTTQLLLQDTAKVHATAENMIENLGLGLESEMDPIEVLVAKMTPPAGLVPADKQHVLLGPLNPGAEEGSEHWYHGINGNGVLLTDNTDPASGENDFTVENTSTNGHNYAEWRCETFSLGPATNGAHPVTFSFDYKLPGPVNDGDNVRVQLRFFDQNKDFIDQKIFWLGSSSHDSAMTSYKTVTTENIQPPAGARLCDVTLSANLYDDKWSSGTGRFDNILVTTAYPASK